MSKEEFDHLSFEEIDLQNQTQLNQIALEAVSKMYEKTTSNPECIFKMTKDIAEKLLRGDIIAILEEFAKLFFNLELRTKMIRDLC